VGPGDLEAILSKLPEETAPELVSSIRDGEDAGVFLLSDDAALVQTVDFIPPIVDDPYQFGQIVAANALSDIYAMGARPLTAMNLVAYPCGLPVEVIETMLLGGHDKVHEAGAVVVGGHTIEDDELKYGLAVAGLAKPGALTRIGGAVPGDSLVLTKPLGTGILATALKAGFISEEEISEAVRSMLELNRHAAEVFGKFGVNACTDVTGFGLIGHLYEMMRAGRVSAVVWADRVPLFAGTLEMAGMGMVPGAERRERSGFKIRGLVTAGIDGVLLDCLYDPQTSGGLLASVPPGKAEAVLRELRAGAFVSAAVIGEVREGAEVRLEIVPEGG
jgi:selenide,water dikinase